ncbi:MULTISPECIES: tRNA (cytosine(32)/uridine(32)-2'-O)-methyltransferase TrmJ [Aeromonas]|jgi:tRNA (cytidine32/uridine32-2'-O)-methyltransferase|uniref:tRNA (cytosine(32)/uridine(32)-2'-O)-methyltransferase TrmJ n=1 Tax=Aeromonas TaxID=642 RepID=UPI001119DBAB|nr:tRNA (cytosine(32)/uridine(32)-2'-O)-methyltransferase TrmJ [Aeromonas hydrophila]MBQ4667169.1 tRNA (cytosine(32)/uridine(32)-2'-O)-methyltransferase TrmJ [Aeromonas hydrophila]MBQ4714468.1 tRNA (cytosine(32)/uridine(32)-2'-O)-methyltransferase TrmJ [Aeromonas hydrophila]MBW3798709.1 tRNA (cytosine(32)/uridine(32)-2'-O)-methyltransferase TrmJ [Aeromonas hydrophila]MBW3801110.1 tRNA (cytosine(32)/uridine(32)-2'-O)-methyltransferase TrmJ [Aeromonas hydrophila]MBW3817528.1 tRNA (cytosine(32)/u
MLDQIRIVLVNTSHTGNMGSAARAMKTMGLSQMVLVDPQAQPDDNAYALAAGASDLLANARIVSTLDEAIADCGLVIGTSARSRTLSWPMLDPREAGEKLVTEGMQHPVALVFGRERTGLTNDELQKCHYHVAIPANPEYSSLNLAMAVQTLCYEVRMHWLQQEQVGETDMVVDYPSAEQLEGFYQHLEQTLLKTGFIADDHPGQVMSKLRRLFNRARPEAVELNILRGILTSVQKPRPQD